MIGFVICEMPSQPPRISAVDDGGVYVTIHAGECESPTTGTNQATACLTRRSVLASHFERVFSWTFEMQRLDWKLISAIAIDAIHEGWTYTITQQPGKWLLCVQPILERGPDWRKWFETRYLQDALAIAEAIAAGVNI